MEGLSQACKYWYLVLANDWVAPSSVPLQSVVIKANRPGLWSIGINFVCMYDANDNDAWMLIEYYMVIAMN